MGTGGVIARARSGRVANAIGPVFANPDLRRIELAFAGFNSAEWSVWIAMLVYAFGRGGALAAGLVALAQLIPSAVCAPFAATLADRAPPARVLALGYVLQAGAMGATALVLILSGPPLLAYALAAASASAVTITRPTQAVLIPALVHGLDELTGANVVTGWIESLSLLVAPVVTGVMLTLSGPGVVFALMAGVAAGAALLVAPVRGPPRAPGLVPGRLAQASTGLRAVARDPAARVLVGVLGTEFLLIGALDVLFVVIAIDVLGLGGSGAGYLNAAFGAGGVLGIWATVRLIGRPRLAPPVVIAALVWSGAFLVLGVTSSVVGAFALLALAGGARTLLDVAVRTLLQRTAPSDALAGVFGLLETLDSLGLAVGSLLAPALVAVLGAQAAIAGLAAVLPAMLLIAGRQLREIDAHATVPVVEVALLRTLPIFAAFGAPALEGVARAASPLAVNAGTCLIREGEIGDRYYAIVEGTLEVTSRAGLQVTVGRGDGVGEVALLAGVPRTATVTAQTPARLLAIDAEQFIEAITAHPASARVAAELVEQRLAVAGSR